MECPECREDIVVLTLACPRCGASLAGRPRAADDVLGIVESTAERGPISAELPLPPESDVDGASVRVPADGEAASADTRLVVSRVGLPAVLWRQSAVRSVAQAGAGVIVLTLGMRLVRAWLARPRAVRAVASTAFPMVADLLQSAENGGGELPRGERGSEVVETVFYMRRVWRRRA